MSQLYEEGGSKMIDIGIRTQSLNVSWIGGLGDFFFFFFFLLLIRILPICFIFPHRHEVIMTYMGSVYYKE